MFQLNFVKLALIGVFLSACGTAQQDSHVAGRSGMISYQPSESQLILMQQVLDHVNQHRSKLASNCPALRFQELLITASYLHLEDMLTRDYFGHEFPGDPASRLPNRLAAVGYRYTAAGENIAAGQVSSADVMNSWMNSPGHRKNILNCQFREIGIGVLPKILPSGRQSLYWIQIFGAR